VSLRRALLAALAMMVALAAGGFAGWGLHHARASSPTPAPTATVTPPPAPTPGAGQRRRVALFGDSLTYGSGLDAPQDLPSVLAQLRTDLDVVDLAVGGNATTDLLSRVRQVRLLNPDSVLLWVGGQDSDDRVPVPTYRANLEKLLSALAPARVVLVTPIPDYSVSATQFAPYAAAVRDVGRAHNLTVVDLGTPPQSQYQDDGMHLDAVNDARVARLFATAL
jgi:lysophospholipase L1-like esterase